MTLDETTIANLVNQVKEIETRLKVVESLLTASQSLIIEKNGLALKQPEPHYTTVVETWYSENSGIDL